LNRGAPATRVFHFIRRAIEQALTPVIFHLDDHPVQQSVAPGVIHLNRRNLVPRVIHLNYLIIGLTPTPKSFFTKSRSS
jgi:hypothetical protein